MRKLGTIVVVFMLLAACSSSQTAETERAAPQMVGAELEQACLEAGGTFIAEHNECENISEAACEAMGGAFDACASACRHQPPEVICTMQCVQVCAFGVSEEEAEPPRSVIAQLNNPLPCSLAEEPIVIGIVTAHYRCEAPGAFLTEVDTSTEPWTAGYFTTDTQISKVTFGPEEVEVLSNPNAQ